MIQPAPGHSKRLALGIIIFAIFAFILPIVPLFRKWGDLIGFAGFLIFLGFFLRELLLALNLKNSSSKDNQS